MTDQPHEGDEHPLEEELPLGVTEEHPADVEDDDSQ